MSVLMALVLLLTASFGLLLTMLFYATPRARVLAFKYIRAFPAVEARRLVERFKWHTTLQNTAAASIWPNRTRRPNEICQPRYFFQRLLATASAKLRAVGSAASLVRSVTRIFKNLWAAPVT
jgi:hypothetical protein